MEMVVKKFKLLLKFLGREAIGWLLVGSTASIVLSLVEIAISILMQVLFFKINLLHDVFVPNKINFILSWSLIALCITFGVISAVRAVLTLLTSQSGNYFSTIINTRLKLMSAYDLLMVYRTKVLPSSELNLRFSEIYPKTGSFVASATSGIISLVQMLSLFIALTFIGWKETIVGLIGVAIIGTSLKLIQKGILSYSRKVLSEQENINQSIQRVTQNWINIKILRTQNEEYVSLVDRLLLHFNHLARSGVLTKFGGVFPGFLGNVLLAFIIFLSSAVFKTSGPAMLAFLYLFLRFVQCLSSVADSYFNALSNYPHFQRAFSIFVNSNPADISKALIPSSAMKGHRKYVQGSWSADLKNKDQPKRMGQAPEIKIETMSFRWQPSDPAVFEKLSIVIPKNSIYGIIGPSGRGKSTLLLLILGILKPDNGDVTIENISAENYLNDYSADVGYVGPDPFLIAGTIKDNLLYGQTDKDLKDEDFTRVLKAVQLDFLVNKLNYIVTENAEGLSSGQKQRLSLARTLLRKPKFLILDEASANLDHVTETHIANLLLDLKKDCTTIVVTHREAMIKHADFVLDLNKSFI